MIRFKRLGFLVEAYTDDFMMQTNSAMVQSATLVIGISLSGTTKNTILGLKKHMKTGPEPCSSHLTMTKSRISMSFCTLHPCRR